MNKEEVLDKLISEYADRLIKYCYSIVGDYHDAEDAVQDTFVKVYYRLDAIKSEQAVVAYMYRIAYTIGIDILRKRKQRVKLQDRYEAYLTEESYSYEDNKSDGFISEELYQAIMQLKPIDRAIVHAVAVEQLSYRELSLIIDKKETALRKRYERALKKIRKHLEEREDDM